MIRKIKVAHIVESMLGGIRRHVIDIIENLDKDKYEVYLIYSNRRADKVFFEEKEELEKHCTLILCNEMERKLGLNDLKAYKVVKNHLSIIKPDIVHCHSSKAGIVGRLAACVLKSKVIIYTPNAYAFQDFRIPIIKRKIYIVAERYLSRYATTMTINVSKGEMKEALNNRIDDERKFVLIYNGIPSEELPEKESLKNEMSLKKTMHYVGVTARCAKQKDPITFLQIAENVVKKRKDVEFLYIGDGEMIDEMRKYVCNHNLKDSVHILGFHPNASKIVGVLDIYLSTALYEGLPYSMLEALRAGIPVIATNTVGNNELIIDGENGKLFPVGDIEAGARLVIDQIENEGIKKERVRRTYEEKYSLKTMMNRINLLYEEAVCK